MALWVAPWLCSCVLLPNQEKQSKHSPPHSRRTRGVAASCPCVSFLSLLLPAPRLRPVPCGCANRSWMTPLRTICTWVRCEPFAFCHPHSGSSACQSLGVLARHLPPRVVSPFPLHPGCSGNPTEGCPPDAKLLVERVLSGTFFIWMSCSFVYRYLLSTCYMLGIVLASSSV